MCVAYLKYSVDSINFFLQGCLPLIKKDSVFNLSSARISKMAAFMSTCSTFLTNYSRIYLYIIYSHYPPLGECFKTKNVLSSSTQKQLQGPKTSKNGCWLSILLSYTIGKSMERGFQKLKKKSIHSTYFLPCS